VISSADVVERVREWGLAEQVVEKDYVLGWVLWGIGTDPALSKLPALPPLEQFLAELRDLFAWLHGEAEFPPLAGIAIEVGEDESWTPPATAWSWRQGVPLEPVRFAATNHLCVALTYNGSLRLIEPYLLRRTQDGHLVLHALRVDNREHRSYRVDRMQQVEVTTRPFRPIYAVEFSSAGPMAAPPVRRTAGDGGSRPAAQRRARGIRTSYIVQRPNCQKQFRRQKRYLTLRPHKTPQGYNCAGRRGYLLRTQRG
jgi:hypothetical protein